MKRGSNHSYRAGDLVHIKMNVEAHFDSLLFTYKFRRKFWKMRKLTGPREDTLHKAPEYISDKFRRLLRGKRIPK